MFVDVRRRDPEVLALNARVAERVGSLRCLGCGSIELAYVAAGRLDAWLQPDSEPWDWNPGALLVREAGGVAEVRGRWYVASRSRALADELLALTEATRPTLSAVTETRDTAGALTSEEPPSLTEAIGGPLGAAESAVPAAAYVAAYTISGQDTTVALIVAGALGVLFAVARIARGQTVQYALCRASSASRSPPGWSPRPARPRTSSSPACSPTPPTRPRT